MSKQRPQSIRICRDALERPVGQPAFHSAAHGHADSSDGELERVPNSDGVLRAGMRGGVMSVYLGAVYAVVAVVLIEVFSLPALPVLLVGGVATWIVIMAVVIRVGLSARNGGASRSPS